MSVDIQTLPDSDAARRLAAAKIDSSQLPHDVCFCSVCDPACGKHRICRPVRHVYGHLEKATEYTDNYVKFPVNPRQNTKPHLELSTTGGAFDSTTENRHSYVAHSLPPHPTIRQAVWVPNPGRFESVTTQRTDFPVWPNIVPPLPRERRKWIETGGNFSDETTTKTDYHEFDPQPRFIYQRPAYVPNNYKFDYKTTKQDDYRPHSAVQCPVPHKPGVYVRSADNRDFQSTSRDAYKRHIHGPRELRLPEHDRELPPQIKFQASTTTGEAYQKWILPPSEPKRKIVYVKTNAPLESETTYSDSYQPKKLYFPNEAAKNDFTAQLSKIKFDATSTHRADYKPNTIPKDIHKRPKMVYVSSQDNRDFTTTTHSTHDSKTLPFCEAEYLANLARVKKEDGHVYAIKTE